MDIGLYIHIPFCHARCGYCDFVTFTGQESRIKAYVEQLSGEFSLQARQPWGGRPLSTIFFGGGTPSVLEPIQVRKILEAAGSEWKIRDDAEITLEANPESITEDKARGWREAGINRLSIGLQSFDDAILKAMDRLHTAEEFRDAYRAARAVGFDNVSVDLIYGFPEQSMESWQSTLEEAAALEPEHLSLYALTVEEHTPLYVRGAWVNNDQQADMYEVSRRILRDHGYEQYEISNFARPERACRHNLLYWRQDDYIGAGVGAVGCVGGLRWQNAKSLNGYARFLFQGELPWVSSEPLDPATRKFERLMLGLRLREGLAWGGDENPAWLRERTRLASEGLLEEIAPGRWRIPDHRVAVTNQVLLSFIS